MSNEYYEEQWKRFRKKYDVKNKYIPIGKDSSFSNFRIKATEWNDPMLSTMHETIRLETGIGNNIQKEKAGK